MGLNKGRKVREWDKVRAELKRELEAAGITSCELRLNSKCTGRIFLSFAHSKKRRNIVTEDGELREAILACTTCHAAIELMKEPEMCELVRSTIANRGLTNGDE